MAVLKSVHVLVIPVELHGHFLIMVNTPYVGSFADPGHKTALYAAEVSRVMKRSVKLPNLELLSTPRI